MRYRYLDDFPRGILVFAIFSYGIAVLGTPPPPNVPLYQRAGRHSSQSPRNRKPAMYCRPKDLCSDEKNI